MLLNFYPPNALISLDVFQSSVLRVTHFFEYRFVTALCNFLFIYLAALGLSYSMRDLRCHVQDLHCGMLDLLFAACGIFSCGIGI